MAGRFMDEMPGMSFGHAGTIVEGKEDTASEKIARLAEAGITVAEQIEDIPEMIRLARSPRGAAATERRAPMRKDGTFIAVEVDDQAADDAELARSAHRSLPGGHLRPERRRHAEIVEDNLDECVLCRLCLDASTEGAVKVIKLYDNDAVLA